MTNIVDSRKRSWVKALTWRAIGIVILGALTWAFTRDWQETIQVTAIFNAIRFVLYYFHERRWERVKWGRREVKEDYTI